ncbi:MAG: sigma-54-dependent Fis family transcriptional regulator [Eubacteriales bacterium]
MSNFNPFYYHYSPELLAFENAWVDFIKSGQVNSDIIEMEVAESWKRCRNFGLDPLDIKKQELISESKLESLKSDNKSFINVALPFMKMLFKLVENSGFRVDLCDRHCNVLITMGDAETLELSQKTNSLPGSNQSEEVMGTTATGMAKINKHPIQIAGAEHYRQILHRWTCSAAPILDSNNNLLGIINISGRYELTHEHTLGMIAATAKAIENEIRIQRINNVLIENNSHLAATLSAVTDGVVYVKNGIIAQINKAMAEILGEKDNEVIGKILWDAIKTTPGIEEALNRIKVDKYVEVSVKQKNKIQHCLLSLEYIDESQSSYVLIFTRTEEIRMLARKINKYTAFFTFNQIIGNSNKIKEAISLAQKASNYNFKVLIEGESGTGKEMFAQAIHNESLRKNKPFIAVDCGAIPHALIESEMFGYEEGAFTGARRDGKLGKFELANGGTIFLDEIGNMPMEMQAKMLRVLQEEKITRIGGTTPIPIDVRVLTATNCNLEDEVKRGNFREDLYYRLNVIYIKLPALRERREDIPLLVEHFIKEFNTKKSIDKKVMALLEYYDWPGNIRQLHNAVERAIMMSEDNKIKREDFPSDIVQMNNVNGKLGEGNTELSLDETVKSHINKVLRQTDGNVSEAARILKINRTTIYNLAKQKSKE